MSVRAFFETDALPSQSPYRLSDDEGNADWANEYLDAQRLRGLSLRSLRAYAYDLVHIARWLKAASVELSGLTEARLTDYIGYQLNFEPQPAAQTINHRLCVTRCLYRFHFGGEIPAKGHSHGCALSLSPPFGYGRHRRLLRGLGVKVPRRVVVPLSSLEIAQFWRGFKTYRDLGIVSLMLFCGLRSCEVLSLQMEDLNFSQKQILVLGKGNRQRMLPLDTQAIKVIERYLLVERPRTNSSFVFVVLKGPNRGAPLKPAGLRTVFRYHRTESEVHKANPHRFRHTFGADMVRAGISLPALMNLMGHSHIHTTMLYVQLSPKDVWREFQRAIENRDRPSLPETP
jgi:integrase/recombinase XerD